MSRPTLKTSVRSRPFAQTWTRASALMPALGISRVTDITRMDRLGVPVCASVRPRGRTLRVHAGKGLGVGDARVGALMEAVEVAVAECAGLMPPDARLSVAELDGQFDNAFRFVDLAPQFGVPIAPGQGVSAVRCEDLTRGGHLLMPSELVFVGGPIDDEASLFGWNTHGLASGNSLAEATLHAVLEVLERDAVAMNGVADRSCSVDTATLPEPFVHWARSWQDLGIALIVRQVPSALDLPCFEAFLHERRGAEVDLASGSALHVSRDIALARAVCEAARSRLSHIHGGRDDIRRFHDAMAADHQPANSSPRIALQTARTRWLEAVTDSRRRVDYHEGPQGMTLRATPEGLLSALLRRLSDAGFTRVLRRRMDTRDRLLERAGLHVVKVVVPRCEVFATGGVRRGPRLLAQAPSHG